MSAATLVKAAASKEHEDSEFRTFVVSAFYGLLIIFVPIVIFIACDQLEVVKYFATTSKAQAFLLVGIALVAIHGFLFLYLCRIFLYKPPTIKVQQGVDKQD